MIYELRLYYLYPDQLPALHKRFANHTLKLFEKHGIKTVDSWDDTEGKDALYYIVEFADRQSRDQAWISFQQDPEWQEAKRQSELDGPIVERVESIFMNRAEL
jgi:hypothetical protein